MIYIFSMFLALAIATYSGPHSKNSWIGFGAGAGTVAIGVAIFSQPFVFGGAAVGALIGSALGVAASHNAAQIKV